MDKMTANIIALHLGCDIKTKSGGPIELVGVEKYFDGTDIAIVKGLTMNLKAELKDCKLLLKPLSKITEEDKRAVAKQLYIILDHTKVDFEHMRYFQKEIGLYIPFSFEVKVWLECRGYDCGLVPDEHKEVQ